MSRPEELLCSRKWRMRRGTWMLWGWFPFAFTAWIGYLFIGIKARNWKWIATAIGFFAFGLTSFILIVRISSGAEAALGQDVGKGEAYPEPWDTYNSIVFFAMLVVWVGNAAVVQWLVNRKWLVWRAYNDPKSATPWYATATATPHAAAGTMPASQTSPVAAVDDALRASSHARDSSIPRASSAPFVSAPVPGASEAPPQFAPPAPGSLHAPRTTGATPAPIDLNTATRDQLATLPGIDLAWADHIIATRERLGGFASPADLVTAASVQPHVFTQFRDQLVVAPPAVPRSSAPKDGRRLEF